MGLIEQDVVIAMHLVVEDCQHRLYTQQLYNVVDDSLWGPYLDILPNYTIPRLDTFGEEEYAALQDANLERVGRSSILSLERLFWAGGQQEGGTDATGTALPANNNEPSLQSVILDVLLRKLDMTTPPPNDATTTGTTSILDSCTSFTSFHHFVGIVGSRAMVLNGIK